MDRNELKNYGCDVGNHDYCVFVTPTAEHVGGYGHMTKYTGGGYVEVIFKNILREIIPIEDVECIIC